MLTAPALLGTSFTAARRQAWVGAPLFVAVVLTRLLALIPSAYLTAWFLRTGIQQGETSLPAAYLVGLTESLSKPAPWIVAGCGHAVAIAGAVLLLALIRAGILRQLAAQSNRPEPVSDEAFNAGMLANPARYLVAALGVFLLKLVAIVCAVGTVAGGMTYFRLSPGPLAALLMTVATAVILTLPLLMAALDLGFARAVLLDEPVLAAVGDGLALAWTRSSALLPAWYGLAFLDLVAVFWVGIAGAFANALPTADALWILKLGPTTFVALTGIACTTAVELWRLSLYATLVEESRQPARGSIQSS